MSDLLEKTRRLNKLLQEGSENDSTYIGLGGFSIDQVIVVMGRHAFVFHDDLLHKRAIKVVHEVMPQKRAPFP